MTIKIDTETLKHIAIFENITKATIKDTIILEDKLIFVVNKGFIGIAIGKEGRNIKILREKFNKRIEIIGYSDNLNEFIKNIFHKYNVCDIKIENARVIVKVSPTDKAKAIGKNCRNLQIVKMLLSRHYNISDVVIK